MGNWNALGAAAYATVFLGAGLDLGQNWEWLHVRGAQIGGATDSTNLIAGLYVTNSAMIPFESMIEAWAKTGAKTHNPQCFQARFVATGIRGVFCDQIELWIQAAGHPELDDLPARCLATFNPRTGAVVDKLANELIKRKIDQTYRVYMG